MTSSCPIFSSLARELPLWFRRIEGASTNLMQTCCKILPVLFEYILVLVSPCYMFLCRSFKSQLLLQFVVVFNCSICYVLVCDELVALVLGLIVFFFNIYIVKEILYYVFFLTMEILLQK